jgi:pimeloyl-ACP methyl ester carboxylesterase
VVIAHGSASRRHDPRQRHFAASLREGGLATLVIDLMTPAEEAIDQRTGDYRYDIGRFARRLIDAADWLSAFPETRRLSLAYLGLDTGAAAALQAAAERPTQVNAIVSIAGRPDLVGPALSHVRAPTLLLVGADDEAAVDLHREAYQALFGPKRLELIPEAFHLATEPDGLELAAPYAREWLERHLSL